MASLHYKYGRDAICNSSGIDETNPATCLIALTDDGNSCSDCCDDFNDDDHGVCPELCETLDDVRNDDDDDEGGDDNNGGDDDDDEDDDSSLAVYQHASYIVACICLILAVA